MSLLWPSRDSAALDDDVPAPVELVRAPVVPPFHPLQPRASAIVHRKGAFDYRNIPSMMGSERVPFKSSDSTSEA